jgi:hypothetical protein
MMLGLSLSTFTWVHTALSLIALVAGIVVVIGLLAGRRFDGWIALFLLTAVLTSVTGFGFPFDKFLPSHWTGVVSLVVLAMSILAIYVFRASGLWRWIFAVTAVIGLYLDAFVAVVQAFIKLPALNALAPTQTEAPFLIAQGVLLVIFVALAIAAAIRFHPDLKAAAAQRVT